MSELIPINHSDLTLIAEKWLTNRCGCSVVLREMRAVTRTGEVPDVIGWYSGVSILIEAKTSRSDFLADKNKPFRIMPETGMGDWRFYLCLPDVIRPEDLPMGWGLLYFDGKKVKRISGVPTGNCSWKESPFEGNKISETSILVSALRRLK